VYGLARPIKGWIGRTLAPGAKNSMGGERPMATTVTAAGILSDREHTKQLRRAIIASTVGTAIEWYDFFLYGAVTAIVFAKLYFPNSDPLAGTLSSFGIYAVGFVARPVGAAIFGHYGDRIGRKATLIATLMLMGIATFLVGFVPSYDSIGIWGAIILTVLRFIQGVGVGGEWGGSVLLSMEWSKTSSSRGFIASWPQFGVPCGLLLSNLAFLAFSAISGDQFITWGWRVPFFLSIVLVGVGLYIRLGILETPIFTKLVAEKKIVRQPMLEVIRRNPKEILLSAFVRVAEQAPFYIFTTYVFAYGTGVLKMPRDFLLLGVMAASVLSFFSIPLSGHISDLIGRRRMYMLGAITVGVFGFVYFGLMNTGSTVSALTISYKAPLYDTGIASPDGSRRLFSGESEQIAGDIRAFAAIGVHELIFDCRGQSIAESIERLQWFATDVIPLVDG
jgi:MFS family permease